MGRRSRYKPKQILASLGIPELLTVLAWYEKRYGELASLRVIDVKGARGAVEIDGMPIGKNMLLHNFWALFNGVLFDANVEATKAVGGRATLRTSGDVNALPAEICVGNSDYPVAFEQYDLQGSYSCTSTTRTVSIDSANKFSRITISAPAPQDGYETGVRQKLYDTGGSQLYFFYSRKVVTVTKDQTVVHRWDFYQPWLFNWASIMWGIISNANVAVKDISGSSLTARTSEDGNAGGARMVISQSSVAFDPEAYSIPNMVEISTYRYIWSDMKYVIAHILGIYVPDTDIDVYTVGLVQSIFDEAGNTFDVLMALYPLSTPVHMKAGRPNMILWRIVAF